LYHLLPSKIVIVIKIFTHPREVAAAVILVELTSWVALSDRHGAIDSTSRTAGTVGTASKLHHRRAVVGFWGDWMAGTGNAGTVAPQARLALHGWHCHGSRV